MNEKKREAARRQGIFARHIAECDACTHRVDKDGIISPVFCMSGSIMAGHMIRATQEANDQRSNESTEDV